MNPVREMLNDLANNPTKERIISFISKLPDFNPTKEEPFAPWYVLMLCSIILQNHNINTDTRIWTLIGLKGYDIPSIQRYLS